MIRIVSQQEYKELPTPERIYWHMMDPIYYRLNPTEEGYFNDLNKVFVAMTEELEERRIRKKLHSIMPDKEHYFAKMMNDVEVIFGPIRKINKDFQKALQRERIKGYIYALKKEQPKDYLATIVKYEELLMKLDGLHLADAEGGFDWSTLQLPQITYSSATAFLSDGSEDIEIIDDEDEV